MEKKMSERIEDVGNGKPLEDNSTIRKGGGRICAGGETFVVIPEKSTELSARIE